MLLRVECGKGGQYRNAMLSADLLTLLRQRWKIGRQQGVMHRQGWLFPGQHAMKPISTRQLYRIVVEARAECNGADRKTAMLRYITFRLHDSVFYILIVLLVDKSL
jgi:hypothetical protein